MVEAASVTKTKYKHDKSQNIGVDVQCAQSMAVSTLLRSRCLAMSTQAYRVALLLWNSGAKKQVSFSVSTSACLASFLQDCGGFYTEWYTICVSYYDYYPMCHSLFHARKKTRSYKHCCISSFNDRLTKSSSNILCMSQCKPLPPPPPPRARVGI